MPTPPFKADHVGSLLRPKSILDARAAHQDGTLSADALSDIESREIARIVGKQKDVGL
jgi:methionine synthase II (cobalamin-independent)